MKKRHKHAIAIVLFLVALCCLIFIQTLEAKMIPSSNNGIVKENQSKFIPYSA